MSETRRIQELAARRKQLLRDSWEMVCYPPPEGEQAGYAFDAAQDEIERELATVEAELKQLRGVHEETPQ